MQVNLKLAQSSPQPENSMHFFVHGHFWNIWNVSPFFPPSEAVNIFCPFLYDFSSGFGRFFLS